MTEIRLHLRKILVGLYSQKTSIRRVIEDASIDAARIDFDATPVDIWHFVLIEAEKVSRVDALLQVVEDEYGTNSGLRDACHAYRRAIDQPAPNHALDNTIELLRQNSEPLMNCAQEMTTFKALLDGTERHTRVIVLQGPHGCGKSRLLNEYRRLAEQQERLVVHFDLSQQLPVERCLERIAKKLADIDKFSELQQHLRMEKPDSLSKQWEWQKQLTLAFFANLHKLPSPADSFILFDHFEKADPAFRAWFLEEFLTRLEDEALGVIVAGRSDLEATRGLEWVRFFTPKVPAINHFYEYAETVGVQVDTRNMNALYMAFQATPKGFVDYVNALRLQQQGVSL